MLDIEIGGVYEEAFAVLKWIDINNARYGKIAINSMQDYYEHTIETVIVHENIHWVIIKLEGESVSRRLDHLFPTVYDSHSFVDCYLERHILFRKKYGEGWF